MAHRENENDLAPPTPDSAAPAADDKWILLGRAAVISALRWPLLICSVDRGGQSAAVTQTCKGGDYELVRRRGEQVLSRRQYRVLSDAIDAMSRELYQ